MNNGYCNSSPLEKRLYLYVRCNFNSYLNIIGFPWRYKIVSIVHLHTLVHFLLCMCHGQYASLILFGSKENSR